MKFAVNYSHAAAELRGAGRIAIDCFKCPPWPELVAIIQETYPTYVHFALKVGQGSGDALDFETNQAPDWDQVEALLTKTDTPLVNLHLVSTTEDYPGIPADTNDPAHIELLTKRMIQDVRAVVARFGAASVVVENDHDSGGTTLRPAFLPEVVCRVVEETGCGLLLDLSHACLAARYLGVDARAYTSALPVERAREIHVTGLQRFAGHWVERVRKAGIEEGVIQPFAGRLLDHLPMTDADWAFFAWSMDQVRSGAWGRPWAVTFEYGGVGPLFEAITDVEVLAEQVPRVHALVRASQVEPLPTNPDSPARPSTGRG